MKAIDDILQRTDRPVLAGAPEGQDARILAALVRAGQAVIHVARDDARLERLRAAVMFFAPEIEILCLPAWDCLPYDRVSPRAEITASRMDTLARLVARASTADRGAVLLLTTLNAAVQKLPPREALVGVSLSLKVGEELALEKLLEYFSGNGFTRAANVMEPGEFAVRGGIVDVFPPGGAMPLRLDFFGDQLESIRGFDPLTQRSSTQVDALRLIPVSEVPLDEASVARFRAGYRELFGAVTGEDPLYEAISARRRHPGMEHWLALFYPKLETVFQYLPDGLVCEDSQTAAAMDARQELIADYYDARANAPVTRFGDSSPYQPVPPERLYLSGDGYRAGIAGRAGGEFSPFRVPDGDMGAMGAGAIDCAGRQGKDFASGRAAGDGDLFALLGTDLNKHMRTGARVLVAGYSEGSASRLEILLNDHDLGPIVRVNNFTDLLQAPKEKIALTVLPLERGFRDAGLVVVGEQDILGDRLWRSRRRSRKAENFLREATDLSTEDLVVHTEHGIGRYRGLVTLEIGGAPHDCLLLVYAGDDRLYVPVENIEVLSRFGDQDLNVQLDRLGGAGWQARKAKLKERLRDMADRLIKIAAERELRRGAIIPRPVGYYEEFCARFAFEETEDQLSAINDVFEDLESGRPMDRLICGDVGFGKTEVALRSAFATVMEGGQVAVVTPTTLLCRQHFQTFSERFSGLPVQFGQLSRLVSTKDAAATRAGLADGRIDLVIGTHALLSKHVKFKDLKLLIIDEEQHFGVAHKERLKQLRSDVHVLTLTATPIPRTLQMALSGVKELSLIATPPVDRLAVRTFIAPFDPIVVREALMREYFRGGQSFYVCPRVSDLAEAGDYLKTHLPDLKVRVAHGRMAAADLEDVMSGFYDHRFDVLLSTTIIESGLDISNANTLIVHRADMFGLAQLYQIRGRIGRSKNRAYAYFTLPPRRRLTAAAEKRLKVLQSLDSLGAGFSLASHDLDIRGAGNLLGEEQSGHIREVGLELYQRMLEEAVALARAGDGQAVDIGEGEWSPQINIGTAVLIPEEYVRDLNVRLGLYRRLARLATREEIDGFAAELVDRFGSLPDPVEHLLQIVAIKTLCRRANIARLDAGPAGASLSFHKNEFANPAGLVDFISRQPDLAKLRLDHSFVYKRAWPESEGRLRGVLALAEQLANIAEANT